MSRTTINDSLLGSEYSASANILDNAGFEIWQRGTSFSNPINAYTADRYLFSTNGGGSWTITREASVIDSGQYSLKWNVTAVNTNLENALFQQFVENYQAYANKTVNLSMRVWCNQPNTVRIYVGDNIGSTISSFHPGDSTWHTISVTYTLSASPATLVIGFGCLSSNGETKVHTSYYDSAMLTVGNQAANFIAVHPQIDLARCQRYFNINNNYDLRGQNFNTGGTVLWWQFPVTMRTIPTMTVNASLHVQILGTGVGSMTGGGANYNGSASVVGIQGSLAANTYQGIVCDDPGKVFASADL